MRTSNRTLGRGASALGGVTLATLATLGLAGPAHAIEYWLQAAPVTVQMPAPDGAAGTVPVTMWGYGACGAAFAGCTPATVPGPALTVPPGDTTLTVHLGNTLAVPTSIVINGLVKAMTPVWTDGTSGARGASLTKRVRSFDAEAAPASTQDYTWNNVAPGTYLYQSGTQPQVQVQMGLYGAATKNAVDVVTGTTPVRGQAYAASGTQAAAAFEYDNQALLLYSEIDPALHAAVAGGTYGVACPPATPDCGNPTSTLTYAPKYFLVNGQPFPFGAPVLSPAGNPGRTLLRLLNAGLVTHVPMVQGAYWTVIAEDGKAYPYPRTQYTALLPAAKTMDVLLSADNGGGAYTIMDRRLSLSNAGVSNGGMLTVLQYAAAGTVGGGAGEPGYIPPAPVADTYSTIVGVTLNVGAVEGVLANDVLSSLNLPLKAVVASGATAAGGSYVLNANGSFTYIAPATLPSSSADSFAYQVTDGKAISASTVTINLSVPTVPVIGVLDPFNRADANSLGAAWTQTAASGQFPDVQIAGNQATAATANLGGLAIWNAGALGTTQGASFANASPLANVALVLKASGGTVAAPANFVRVRCEPANGGELVIATLMGGSNTGVYVKQAAFAAGACAGSGSLSAVVDAKGLVTAFVNGAYVGGVQLPDVGAWKGTGYIGLQVQNLGALVDDFGGF